MSYASVINFLVLAQAWAFCQDVNDEEALVMALSQKPIAGSIFGEAAGKPAWKEKAELVPNICNGII